MRLSFVLRASYSLILDGARSAPIFAPQVSTCLVRQPRFFMQALNLFANRARGIFARYNASSMAR